MEELLLHYKQITDTSIFKSIIDSLITKDTLSQEIIKNQTSQITSQAEHIVLLQSDLINLQKELSIAKKQCHIKHHSKRITIDTDLDDPIYPNDYQILNKNISVRNISFEDDHMNDITFPLLDYSINDNAGRSSRLQEQKMKMGKEIIDKTKRECMHSLLKKGTLNKTMIIREEDKERSSYIESRECRPIVIEKRSKIEMRNRNNQCKSNGHYYKKETRKSNNDTTISPFKRRMDYSKIQSIKQNLLVKSKTLYQNKTIANDTINHDTTIYNHTMRQNYNCCRNMN